jgi:antitoxin YefM
MPRVKLDTDIKPVSEFRAKAADLIERVRNTRRPLVLTQRGRSAAVVLAVDEYEQLLEEIETLRDLRKAEDQINRGQTVSNQHAKIKLRRRFGA